MTGEKLLNVNEAAKLIGVSISFVYKKISNKELPHYKIGARVLLSMDQILWFLKENEQQIRRDMIVSIGEDATQECVTSQLNMNGGGI